MKDIFLERLALLRDERGLTQAQFARLFNLGQSTFSNWLQGRNMPKLNTICDICREFNVSADWLLGISDVRTRNLSTYPAAERVAEPAARYGAQCPSCTEKDRQISRLIDSISNLTAGRPMPVSVSPPS